jgi:outer membrane autotransporter protein
MNTLWNAPGDTEITVAEGGADSESDVLHITGTAEGTTTVNPIASDGTNYVIDGSVQQLTNIINTLPVIIVDTTNAAGTFIGTAQTTGATEVQLTSRVAANGGREYYWTMAAMPIYNPSVPGYVETPRVDMELGYATLRTLHERRGENQTLAWDECGDCGLEAKGQAWARIFGNHLEQDGETRFGMDTDIYGIQAGYDFTVKRNDKDGHRLTGLYFAYGRANTDFSDKYRAVNGIISDDKYTGNGKTDAYSLGITNTYYKSNGTYIDLVGQASFLQNKYDSRSNVTANNNGFGLILSAEVGRPYAINDHTPGETGWLIEPQAQLIYQYLKLDKFSDGTRNIDQNSQSGLRGRIGFRIARNSEAKNYQTNTFYGVANVWHDFLNPKEVNIGQDGLKETYASTWGEIGLGIQFPLAKELYLYSDARYERSFGGADRDGYRGTLGLKYTWK